MANTDVKTIQTGIKSANLSGITNYALFGWY